LGQQAQLLQNLQALRDTLLFKMFQPERRIRPAEFYRHVLPDESGVPIPRFRFTGRWSIQAPGQVSGHPSISHYFAG
jgi:hypothetical protein